MGDVWARVILPLIILLAACTPLERGVIMREDERAMPTPVDEAITSVAPIIRLPAPEMKGTLTLEEALAKRRSVRSFTASPLTQEQIGQLLWAAQGLTHPAGYRSAPSAGALYPLEVYAITREGVYHYDPAGHRLSLHQPGDLRPGLHRAALRQEAVLHAPVVVVITAVFERTAEKYGEDRSPRYVHMEAGHAAQNLLLQAVALDLGAVPIGAFNDGQVKEVLLLPDRHQPLYLIPVGNPG